MLSPKTISIVKATALVVADNAETLTRHFYKRMFRNNPEVMPYFNQAHQHEGRQQKALAAAICAYAANIDRLEILGSAVELIAQKHASLKIKPEHYPIVGENLLGSIREVLGQGATEEVIEAWGEAYGFLAGILISREKEIYDEQSAKAGWTDFKGFTVIRKEVESNVITSFYLMPNDGSTVPAFKPGQYITLRIPTADGKSTTMRNYSLSDKPGRPWFRISVKREDAQQPTIPAGYVSNLLHYNVEVGSVVEVAAPCGEFVLGNHDTANPLVFLSAGVGVTPIYSMLAEALDQNAARNITLVHAARNPNMQAFHSSFSDYAAANKNLKVHYRYSEGSGYPSLPNVQASEGFVDANYLDSLNLSRDADYYLCGPEAFIAGVSRDLEKRGVAKDKIRFEFFGPKL